MTVRLTARLRLAAVYVGLVTTAGVALVALTYWLVSSRPTSDITYRTHNGTPPADPPPIAERGVLDDLRTETLDRLLVQSLLALGVVVVLAGLAGWLVAGWLLRPIRAISQTAQRVSATDLSERVATTGPADELTTLADTINGMLDRVQDGVVERDRLLASQQLFVANAAHELRTPLTTMRTAIDVTLDGDSTSAELRTMVGDVSTAVDTSRRTLDGLLALAHSQTGAIRREPVDLADTAAGAIEQARAEADRHRIRLTARLDPAPVLGEATLLARLTGNLLDNALRYNRPDGEMATMVEEHSACLRVTNTGTRVDPADLGRLFEPFVRGAGRVRAAGGAGLGLSIVRAITAAHDGSSSASAPVTGGLDITIRLPHTPNPPLP